MYGGHWTWEVGRGAGSSASRSAENLTLRPASPYDNDSDDERLMQRLRAARERLNQDSGARSHLSVPGLAVARSSSLPPAQSCALARPDGLCAGPIQHRRQHSPGSGRSTQMLKIDLQSLPHPAHIDAERRRIQAEAQPPPSAATDAPAEPPVQTLTPEDTSGSRFGMAPYMELERGEWVWHNPLAAMRTSDRAHLAPSDDAPPASPGSHLSDVQVEWTWAISRPESNDTRVPHTALPTTNRVSVL